LFVRCSMRLDGHLDDDSLFFVLQVEYTMLRTNTYFIGAHGV
jgi:hypothetical protein